jgi:hypothetical protein
MAFFNVRICFYASEVAGGRKYCENEGACNLLIINNKTFEEQKWGCN